MQEESALEGFGVVVYLDKVQDLESDVTDMTADSKFLTPAQNMDFLRLGLPLLCKALEPMGNDEDSETEQKLEDEQTDQVMTDSKINEPEYTSIPGSVNLRRLSDVVGRKVSDASSRSRADSRTELKMIESRTSNLSFRHVMLSMIQKSSESSSDENYDSDNEKKFEFIPGETLNSDELNESKESTISDESAAPDGNTSTENVNPPPERPPKRKRKLPKRLELFDSVVLYEGTVAPSPGQQTVSTTVVHGVDIDTVGDTQQEVSSIHQGEDLVTVDVTGEIKHVHDDPYKNSDEEEENQESDILNTSGLSESFKDDIAYDAQLLSEQSIDTRRPSQSSAASIESFGNLGTAEDKRATYHKAVELTVEDCGVHIIHLAHEPDMSQDGTDMCGKTGESNEARNGDSIDASSSESEEPGDEPHVVPPDDPVPLTRVKCLVSMTTPRDTRAHGVSYSPSFVEFDMSVDGFGCLFMPAVAPQAFPGKFDCTLVGTPVGAVPGVGTGERLFPPQSGLTFASWICIDRYSTPGDDPHPVRLLTVARQFRSGEGKVQNSPCLTIAISAKDRMLVVCTEECASDDAEGDGDPARREREQTEARFPSDLLVEESRWHHVVLVLNRALIRDSTVTLFVDGLHVATSKLKYMQAGISNPEASTTVVAPCIFAYVGTPPSQRRCSRLLWKLGPTHLFEEPLSLATAVKMFLLGPHYIGSFQAPCIEGDSVYALENVDPLVSEDKVMFGVHAHAQSVLTMAKIRKLFKKIDTQAIGREYAQKVLLPKLRSRVKLQFAEFICYFAVSLTRVRVRHFILHSKYIIRKESRDLQIQLSNTGWRHENKLGLSTYDNITPVRLIHNTATHLLGPSRTIGAVIIGCSGMRTFCPIPVTKLIECIGGVSCLLGLIAMAVDVESLYESVKALSCVLQSNSAARRDMERTRGYQILAYLLRKRQHLLNTNILLLTFALVDSDRQSSIPNRVAFRDLLCDLEVWHDAPGDLERSLYSHFLELLEPGNESQDNAELMLRIGLVPKLLFTLQDENVTDSTAHTIANVLSVLLSNTHETKNLLRLGQFLASTLPNHVVDENDIDLENIETSETGADEVDGYSDVISPRRISLRNVLLELVLCLIYGEGGSLDQRFADALQDRLGFDWLLLFLRPHLHNTTVVRATRILVTMLGTSHALDRFKEGTGNGGWLAGTDIMLIKTTYVVAGFNVGAVSDGNQKYEVYRDACNVPGFVMLSSLLPRHVDIPEIYHLVIALLLGHPVSEVYAGAQFDWHHLYSVFLSSSSTGVKTTPPSPRDLAAYTIHCPEAASVLLVMARTMVNETWEDTEEGSWLREYPVTLLQFLLFLYLNVVPFGAVCTGQEFLENLVAILFPKRRRLAKFQEAASDGENEGENSPEIVFVEEKTLLISHPARKYIFEFLLVIMTDSLTCTSTNTGHGVIDTILEAYPSSCAHLQQAEYQTSVLCVQIDYLLGGNLLTNPSTGQGNHAKIVANVFVFAAKVVDKLWIGDFTESCKVVFNFITSIIEAVRGQSVSLDSIYHSLNRTILYQLSRPLARLTDQTSLLEFFDILTTNHRLVFVSGNNEPDFIAGLCHWLLVIGTQRSITRRCQPTTSTPVKEAESIQFPADSNDAAEEFSCTRLLASAAERVWDIFLRNKRGAIDETFKTHLPKPCFTSYSPRAYVDYMPMGGSSNLNLDLKSVRPYIGDTAMRFWVSFVTGEERQKAETLGQQKPKRRTVVGLTSKKSKVETRDVQGLAEETFVWTPKHIRVVKDLVRLHYKNHQQNYQLISKSIAEEWTLMERDLTRERGLWGPPHGSQLDKWALDMVEGPHRMRKKMSRNELFYVHYPYDYKAERLSETKASSADSKVYYMLRGKPLSEIGPLEAVALQQQVATEQYKKVTPTRALSTDPGYVTETNEESEVDKQTIVKLLEAGEKIRSMYLCARVQCLDTAEGLFLFGQQHFYVVDGVTLLSTKEIKDIDSLPPGTHDPIIPRSSHDITKSCTKERMCSKWAYEDIREVHKRRYLLQQTALEVFSSDGRNHFLVFPKPVRNEVYDKLVNTAPTLLESAEDSVSGMKRDTDVETGLGLINQINTLMGERSVTQRWERGEITNFHYLMNLNTLAGRSYNDLMQYPVFPWVLADYSSEELDLTSFKTFRDFSKPMGAQDENRLQQVVQRYREWDDPTGETPPYHYGTHYSSAMIVASYLIRMEPFSQHFLRLQGGDFDLPDRLFHSMRGAWLSAAGADIADVNELIPEFFYLPEFLTNHNRFELGTKQSGEPIGDVILPPWAKNDPREFIRLHRKALECDYVSAHLHEWIDLIFGFKQQGPPAVEACNVFHHLFYEGNVDIHGIDDQVKKTAIIGFINNFGQTPKQLFRRPHPQKKVFRAVEPDLQTGTAGVVNVDRLFFHNLPNLVPSAQPVKELKDLVGLIIQPDKEMLAVERNKVLVPPHYNHYIAWGFGDLSMRMGLYDTERIVNIYENFHIGKVLCAACPDSRTLITGGTSTLVCVWDMVKVTGRDRRPQLLLHEVLYGHQSTVTCLTVSTAYNLIVSGSEDQTCIIWDLNKLSYVTQLSDHASPITAIAINDLTGDIATCAGTHLYVWSVNGQLIVKENTSLQSNNHIQCCAMSELSGWEEENVILTGSLDGVVKMWGVEFYDEAEIKKSARNKKDSFKAADATPEKTDLESRPEAEELTKSPEKCAISKPDRDEQPQSEEITEMTMEGKQEDDKDPIRTPEREADTEAVEWSERAPTLSRISQGSSYLDEEYVIIDNKEEKSREPRSTPVWRRRLVLRHKLTMHTAFIREDNMAPASITALLISKDHRKLFVGDGRGRIYSWSVTDAAGAASTSRRSSSSCLPFSLASRS